MRLLLAAVLLGGSLEPAAERTDARVRPTFSPVHRSTLRPRVLVLPASPKESSALGEDLGSHRGQRWVGVGGRAHPFDPARVVVAPVSLPDLISSCLRKIAPKHRACFRESATRTRSLRTRLASNLHDPRHPLHIPATAQGPANQARERLFGELGRLAETLDALGTHPQEPSAKRKARIVDQLRELLAGFIAFTSMQRGRFGLAVRGGTSMGTYQAGFLYYFSEFLKAHAQRWGDQDRLTRPESQRRLLSHFEIATGSSAGALNALILSSEGCKARTADPSRSLFYRAWVEVGMVGRHGAPGLASARHAPRDQRGFLNQAPIEAAAKLVARAFASGEGYERDCSIDLGLTATRAQQERVPLLTGQTRDPNIEIHRTLERFAFSLRFRVDPQDPDRQILDLRNRRPSPAPHRHGLGGVKDRDKLDSFYLAYGSPENYRGKLAPRALIETALASGAMPLAFSPRSLPYTAFDAAGQVDFAHSGRADFVDGGILDGRPLAFAVDLEGWKRADDIGALLQTLTRPKLPAGDPSYEAWVDELHLGLTNAKSLREWQLWHARSDLVRQLSSEHSVAPTRFDSAYQSWQELLDVLPAIPRTLVFLEPTLSTWSSSAKSSAKKATIWSARKQLFPVLAKHLGNFVGSAREANLVHSVKQHPWIRGRNPGDLRPRVVIPRRSLPIAGERLYRFMAFFERDFRVFDFFAGMADARNFAQVQDPALRLSGSIPQIKDPRFACMNAYFRAGLEGANTKLSRSQLLRKLPACSVDALLGPKQQRMLSSVQNLPKVKRRAIARMGQDWNQSRRSKKQRQELRLAKAAIAAHNFGSMLLAMHNFKHWQLTQQDAPSDEKKFDQFFQALWQADFQYVDLVALGKLLGLRPRQVDSRRRSLRPRIARTIVRHLMQDAINFFAKPQSKRIHRMGISVLGKAGADLFHTYDSRWSFDLGLTFDGMELKLLGHPLHSRFRMDWGVFRAHGLGDYTLTRRSIDDPNTTLISLVDLDLGTRAGLRAFRLAKLLQMSVVAGPTLSWTLNLGTQGPASPPLGLMMTRLGAQLGIELSLLRRIYFELTATHWLHERGSPSWTRFWPEPFDVFTERHSSHRGPCQLGLGNGPRSECLNLSMSVGWRWSQ